MPSRGRRRRKPSTWPGQSDGLSWGGVKASSIPSGYGGSLAIGMLAAKFGDGVNLGFLAETERQVEAHLKSHLDRLPVSRTCSNKSRKKKKLFMLLKLILKTLLKLKKVVLL